MNRFGGFGDDDDDEDEKSLYEDSVVDYCVNEPSDLEDPMCNRCGSTTWSYCTLGDNSTIKRCSDCVRKKSSMH